MIFNEAHAVERMIEEICRSVETMEEVMDGKEDCVIAFAEKPFLTIHEEARKEYGVSYFDAKVLTLLLKEHIPSLIVAISYFTRLRTTKKEGVETT